MIANDTGSALCCRRRVALLLAVVTVAASTLLSKGSETQGAEAPRRIHDAATVERVDEIQLAAPARRSGQFVCGRDIVRTLVIGELPRGMLRQTPGPAAARASGGLTIVVNAGPTLAGNADALAAFQSAIAIWEGWLTDPITVVIDADLAALDPGILGGAQVRSLIGEYTVVRDAMAADAQANETLLSSLPTLAQYSALIPPGFTLLNDLFAPKANFKALGFDMSFDDAFPDATIMFSTGFLSLFDFDPSDGIDAGKFDFEAIVVHEIGHALGFESVVDDVDALIDAGQTGTVSLSAIDMFRLRPRDGAADFTLNPRIGAPGNVEASQMFFDGLSDLGLSTGRYVGDGNQASHWKADEQSGIHIGIMDPTFDAGDRQELTANDVRAFGLVGWDVTNDCNGNAIPDANDIATGASADCNVNGIPDECEPNVGTDTDGDGWADFCDRCPLDNPCGRRFENAVNPPV